MMQGICINRNDKNGVQMCEGDYLRHFSGKVYQLVWRNDVLAFGIESDDEPWELFTDFISSEWEIIEGGY